MSSILMLPEDVDATAHDDYSSGAVDCLDHCERQARILMFGAIRRAAEVAREKDREAYQCLRTSSTYTTAIIAETEAAAIRDAIRTALSTGKKRTENGTEIA